MPLQFTDLTLLAAVADIRRLVQLRALCFLEVGTGFKALGLEASMAHFSVRKLAGGAHITIVFAFLAHNAGIVVSMSRYLAYESETFPAPFLGSAHISPRSVVFWDLTCRFA